MEDIINKLKEEYDKLSNEVTEPLDNWIKSLKESEEYNYNHTSIGLSYQFENASSTLFGKPFCVSNDQFKYAMYKNGYEPDDYEVDAKYDEEFNKWCDEECGKQ